METIGADTAPQDLRVTHERLHRIGRAYDAGSKELADNRLEFDVIFCGATPLFVSHLRIRQANEFNCYLNALFLIDASCCRFSNDVIQPSFSLLQPTNNCHLSIIVAGLEEAEWPSA